jgi:hypothetical protein
MDGVYSPYGQHDLRVAGPPVLDGVGEGGVQDERDERAVHQHREVDNFRPPRAACQQLLP